MKNKKVNKREIVEGITEEYAQRRVEMLLDYAKSILLIIKITRTHRILQSFLL